MARVLRTLLFSTLFPSEQRPTHGIFVETRLRELRKSGEVDTRVVAPVPWFPSSHPRWGERAAMAATPAYEMRDGVPVFHPRYPLLPRIGMSTAPLALALGARGTVARLQREGFDFDLIDAHYYYPDGVAAALLARWFNKPLVITARGTDLNLIPQHRLPRAMIRWAAAQASASVGVCAALMDSLRDLGAAPERLHVLRNGVDLVRFQPLARVQCRAELGLDAAAPLLLSVGHLIERKGHHLVVEAMRELPGVQLVILGEGEERANLVRLIARHGLNDRVRLAGSRPNTELARWYSAADALVLASSREGWANVLLESMACGTPVVATRIWGTPEVVREAVAGELVSERSGPALAAGIRGLLARRPPREAVRAYAEGFGWEPTSRGQLEIFRTLARA